MRELSRQKPGCLNKTGRSENGQGLAEYIIIVILVAIIVLVAVRLFGKSVLNQFGNATQQIDTLGTSPTNPTSN